jgi:hypothetical protein
VYIHVRSGKVLGKVKTMTTTTTAGATGATEATGAAGATTITKSPSSDGTINVDTLSTAAASNVEATFLFVIMTAISAVILACSCTTVCYKCVHTCIQYVKLHVHTHMYLRKY